VRAAFSRADEAGHFLELGPKVGMRRPASAFSKFSYPAYRVVLDVTTPLFWARSRE